VAAGLAQHVQRDLHARPGDQPALLRDPHAEVGTRRVPDRRDAGGEGFRHVQGGFVELQGEGLLRGLEDVRAGHRQVHVAVDQPGQHAATGAVDLVVTVETGADVDDPAVFDRHVGGTGGPGRGVEHGAAAEDGALHRCPRPRRTAAPRSTRRSRHWNACAAWPACGPWKRGPTCGRSRRRTTGHSRSANDDAWGAVLT
jgi:hypothetical protein